MHGSTKVILQSGSLLERLGRCSAAQEGRHKAGRGWPQCSVCKVVKGCSATCELGSPQSAAHINQTRQLSRERPARWLLAWPAVIASPWPHTARVELALHADPKAAVSHSSAATSQCHSAVHGRSICMSSASSAVPPGEAAACSPAAHLASRKASGCPTPPPTQTARRPLGNLEATATDLLACECVALSGTSQERTAQCYMCPGTKAPIRSPGLTADCGRRGRCLMGPTATPAAVWAWDCGLHLAGTMAAGAPRPAQHARRFRAHPKTNPAPRISTTPGRKRATLAQ